MDDSGNGESGSGEERSGESGSDEESGSGDEGNGEIFVTSFYFYTPTKFSAIPERHFIMITFILNNLYPSMTAKTYLEYLDEKHYPCP